LREFDPVISDIWESGNFFPASHTPIFRPSAQFNLSTLTVTNQVQTMKDNVISTDEFKAADKLNQLAAWMEDNRHHFRAIIE
jgi:hypothetical protein